MTAGGSEAPRRPPSTLSFVVPCYHEEEALPELLKRLGELADALHAGGHVSAPPEIVLVDDGSRDRTWELIAAAARQGRVTGVKLSRNCGHQRALLAGLMTAGGELVVSLDADLQDDVAAIPKMVDAWRDGAEIVFGVRDSRDKDTAFKRLTARAYYDLLQRFGVNVLADHADFRLMSRKALRALATYPETNLFLRGLVRDLGFRTAIVTYARGERVAGETKYPLSKMLALAIEGITSFSTVPLRLVTWSGIAVALGSFGYVGYAVLARLAGITIPGWASIVVPIYFLGGIQLIAIGILGEYLGKVYLEVKRRPTYLVDEIVRGGPG